MKQPKHLENILKGIYKQTKRVLYFFQQKNYVYYMLTKVISSYLIFSKVNYIITFQLLNAFLGREIKT